MPDTPNPLAEIIAIAELNQALWEGHVGDGGGPDLGSGWLVPLQPSSTVEPFPVAPDGRPVYPSIELAGVAGAYGWLLDKDDLDVIYANDLAYEVHGIDAVARRRGTDRLVIIESKGTTRPLSSPCTYLKRTRNRGRQLSWDWCWDAVIEMAGYPTTAAAFLALYGPMILNRVDRVLAITRVEAVASGFVIGETKVWEEEALQCYHWLAQERDWERQRAWLTAVYG